MPSVKEVQAAAAAQDRDIPNLAEEVARVKNEQARQAAILEEAFKNTDIKPSETSTEDRVRAAMQAGFRCFVAPAFVNSKFLAKAGKPVNVTTPDGRKFTREREGDIWVKFSGGQLITDDPELIKWCVEHPNVCRDVADPQTDAWATIVEAQQETSTKGAAIPKSLSVESILKGETTGIVGDSLVARARMSLAGRA